MKTKHAHDVRAYREFCFRWDCRCGGVNRSGGTSCPLTGQSSECCHCHEKSRIVEYINDNGCTVTLVRRKKIA